MLSADLAKQLGTFRLEAAVEAESGKPLVVIGESGCGKTTLLNLLAGLLNPDRGRIALDGVPFFDSERGLAVPARERPVGLVFQDYALFPHLTAFENVAFGLRAQHLPGATVLERVRQVLQQVGIGDLAHLRPAGLSGGQRQRVALARALAVEPRLLLLDEPLASLDVQTRREVRAELRRALATLTCVTVFVTHSPLEAMLFGDRIVVIEDGRVAQTGIREELLRRPRSAYVAELMGLNLFHGRVVTHEDGLAVVETSRGRLRVAGPLQAEEAFLAVDPRDVTLHLAPPAGTAQNVFSGRITELVPEAPFGERVRVVLDSDPPIVAEITAHAMRALDLREGHVVFATVKATAARAYS